MTYYDHQSCIEACLKCATVCHHCARMDLRERDVEMMKQCIQTNMECAAACETAAKLMAMGSKYAWRMCRLCADVCLACAEECSRHRSDHCKECAAVCHDCADECKRMYSKTEKQVQ